MNKVPLERLRSLLRLDVDTGLLHWLVERPNGAKPGDVAGWHDRNRYVRLEVDQVKLADHRVAWALHTGYWPPDGMQIDHINGIKTDNRPVNLRLANNSENQSSARSRPGRSGLRGVYWVPQMGRWRAKIMKGKRTIHVGYFHDKNEAHAAYCQAAAEIHGPFHNTESRKVDSQAVANG
ncbi:HNH endonuclease signature motif containing protein [Stenotrophomonas maltophilia]|uniref:HNH endonuclease signature motif containing protein n=1 Tax=Stenotrophomonas maltophilia TaxID=40324 RepID=UPI0021C8530C|nr:HNH endonuclease signature motif containing protein [Stenotrophomonas maltophilia]MCU1140658.1 HNH endonuclease [Stenotrophomonas maltophilia]